MAKSRAFKRFGEALRDARKEKGFTQEELSFASGVHKTYISSVERGERNISLEAILKLAKVLKVSVAQLMEKARL